jgi:tetratricopeptide (TPR) repeat protein
MLAASFAIAFPDVGVVGSLAAHYLRAGTKYDAVGKTKDAVDAFQRGLAAAENESPGPELDATLTQLHEGLADAAVLRGDSRLAATHYRLALQLSPHLTDCWCKFANLQLKVGRRQEAIALYLQALKQNSRHWAARANLAQALMATQQYILAKAVLLELKDERPQDARIHFQLGKTHFELNELELALQSFQQAVTLNPADAESINWIGALRQTMGDSAGAQAAYAEAARIKPLISRPAAKSPAEFRVLALYAPFGGNTPTEYLFQDAFYDTDTLALFASRDYDDTLFGENVQLVINLISDADQTEALLPVAADLVDRFSLPTVNHPRRIGMTTRDAVARLLEGIPNCRVPGALRLKAGADRSPDALRAMLPFSCPILARPVGTHGGDDFEKIEDHAPLAAFLSQHSDHDCYLTQYIDYRSGDGYFRKYRFIFVDGEILPYHLCIGADWKLHHISTDMANQPWMQREEEAFLSEPDAVFAPAHYQALQTIRRRVGLEYCGIDCALDACGDLVVFEVNASMLVHARNEDFPYKAPAVSRIKHAFDEMLRRFAKSGQTPVRLALTSVPVPAASPSRCFR